MYPVRYSITENRHYRTIVALACLILSSAHASIETLNGDFRAAVPSGTRIIALNADGDIFTSDDNGQSFILRYKDTDVFRAVYSVNDTVIAVSANGRILRSTDNGIAWDLLEQEFSPDSFNGLYSVYGYAIEGSPSRWIAVGDNGINSSVGENFVGSIYSSTDDGLTWDESAFLTGIFIRDVIWTGNRWILLGRDLFNNGKIYSSEDGVTWTESLIPSGVMPLLSLAHNGVGVVVAVGELGEVLRSVDDGLTFTDVENVGYNGDLATVVFSSSGVFYLGGDEKVVLQLADGEISFFLNQNIQSSTIFDLLFIDNILVGVGDFGVLTSRTIPLELLISREGTKDFRLTLSQTLTNKVYYLEDSTDLVEWSPSGEAPRLGTGDKFFFDVTKQHENLFWRVVER